MSEILDVSASKSKIVITKGDNKTFNLNFVDSLGVAYNITGSTLKFTVKNDDGTQILQKSWTSHSNPSGGITEFTISDADWALFTEDSGTYPYDIEIMVSGGANHTVITGRFQVEKQFS